MRRALEIMRDAPGLPNACDGGHRTTGPTYAIFYNMQRGGGGGETNLCPRHLIELATALRARIKRDKLA